MNDLRCAFHQLLKNPGFAAVAVLALGISVNMLLFSVFNAMFLRPVPGVKDPRRIVGFKRTDHSTNPTGFPYSDYEEYRDKNGVFSDMFASLDRDVAAEIEAGVAAYSVSQRTREIGIRIALGAQRADVLRLMMRKGIGLVMGGVALGFPGALALSRVLSSALIDLRSFDPFTFFLASLCLAAVMLLACYIPARRATQVDPTEALRAE